MRVRVISSKENPVVKELRALAGDSRQARLRNRTLLDGPHLIESFRRAAGIPELLVVSDSGIGNAELTELIDSWPAVDVVQLPDGLFREVSGVVTPVGILAVIPIPVLPSEQVKGSCVMLDAVQDAGNVGAILRTAAAAGIPDVFLGRGCAGAWTPRVLRAAQGAHFSMRIREQADLGSVLRAYSGMSAVTVAKDGVSLYGTELIGDVAWVFGNEGAGVSSDLVSAAKLRITIPISGETESLNVAAAAAICLFEQVRQSRVEGGGRHA